MSYQRGDMLMLYFPINGNSRQGSTYHPGIVVSGADIYEAEGFFYAVMMSTKSHNPEYTFEVTKQMVTLPNEKYPSFAKCHLLNNFDDRDVDRRIGRLKEPYLSQLIEQVKRTVFDG